MQLQLLSEFISERNVLLQVTVLTSFSLSPSPHTSSQFICFYSMNAPLFFFFWSENCLLSLQNTHKTTVIMDWFTPKDTHSHTHSPLWRVACLFSPLTCSWERRALAMNRWTAWTAMLSSLISERTVKKGAPFSHTLSLPLSFICSFIRVRPSFGQEDQTKPLIAFPSTFTPLLLSSYLLSPLFTSYFPRLPFIPGNYTDMHLSPLSSSSSSTSLFFFFQHPWLFNPVISCLTKLFNNTISVSSRLITFSAWHTLFSSVYLLS